MATGPRLEERLFGRVFTVAERGKASFSDEERIVRPGTAVTENSIHRVEAMLCSYSRLIY